jgi:glycosyltransferase involved in cell wall biosynthesis
VHAQTAAPSGSAGAPNAEPNVAHGAAAPPVRPVRLLQVLGYAGVTGGAAHFGITGVERNVLLLLRGLDRRRFEQYVVYPAAGALLDVYRQHAREILAVEPARRLDARYVTELAQFIARHGIDVVLSHGFVRNDFLVGLACRRRRCPHVVSRAVALADECLPRARRILYAVPDAWTLRHCDTVIAVSEASKRRMMQTQRLRPEAFTVIPNGADVPAVAEAERRQARRALGVGEGDLLIGGVGQLIRRKAFADLVEAVARAQERHPRLVCAILGEGPERPALLARAAARGVDLRLPGYLPDPYPTMAAFDVAVLPSQAEGMPLVVLEAMMLGVPVVATAVAGTPEVIEADRSGLLVPARDPGALAAALERLLAAPELRARLGAAGAQRARERFGLTAMLAGFERCLLGVAARTRSEIA